MNSTDGTPAFLKSPAPRCHCRIQDAECKTGRQDKGSGSGLMIELATVAGTAILVMLLAMWATRPDPSCALTREPHRRLAVERVVDSEHLANDVREIGRIARRHAAAHIAP